MYRRHKATGVTVPVLDGGVSEVTKEGTSHLYGNQINSMMLSFPIKSKVL